MTTYEWIGLDRRPNGLLIDHHCLSFGKYPAMNETIRTWRQNNGIWRFLGKRLLAGGPRTVQRGALSRRREKGFKVSKGGKGAKGSPGIGATYAVRFVTKGQKPEKTFFARLSAPNRGTFLSRQTRERAKIQSEKK